jgi:tripartite-type tricarboxylate transporter receptor subunit TctC
MRRITFAIAGGLLLLAGFSSAATAAANYPAKPVEIICPYVAGASMDIMNRLVAEIAPKYMGQQVVVVNKPGASGSITAAEVISSKPDGYKLGSLANQFFASTLKMQKVPFNPDDLAPIANFMEYRLGIAVKGDSKIKTLNDLIDFAKKGSGQLKWGHPGRGTSLHVGAMYIFRKAGAQTSDVPYKGSPEVLTALLGGHIDAAAIPYGTAKESVRAGNIRYLCFYGEQRYHDQPNVPSVVELGYPDAARLATYVALYVHRNTPDDIKKYLVKVSKQIYDDPRFKKLFEMGGEDPKWGGPEFVTKSVKDAEVVTIPMLKELGMYVGEGKK